MASNHRTPPKPDGDPEDPDARPQGRRATSYDVARLAGVSQSAVSRCFKPGASVSDAMRTRVMAAASKLNYQPNAIARGLITRRSNLVAVLISARLNLYYPEVLFQLTSRLSAEGLRVLLFTIDSEEDAAAMIEQAWQFQVDGVISASHLSIEQCQQLERSDIPVVFFNRYFEAYSTNVVWCDPRDQIRHVVDRLVALGHRRFGLIHGPADNMVNRERMNCVTAALGAREIRDVQVAYGDFGYESGGTCLQDIVAASCGQRPTAIISANDMMALGCIDEARAVLELDVPRDLSVTGFDGIGMAQFAAYELTTIRQPVGRMSDAAIAILKERIERPDQSNEKRVFEGALINGASIAAAPGDE